jgi:hypothetical protein
MAIPTDGNLTDEQAKIAASLSYEIIEKIDACLLSHATVNERKVAMIIGLAMMDPTIRVAGLPDLFYRDRVKTLVTKGLLLAEGNLNRMGYSEVRLP